jgi:putative ABC transport system permease protein
MYVETGCHNSGLWMLIALIVAAGVITIGATTIATALSNVDSRPDLTTLGAVAGFLPAYAWVHSQARSADLSGGTHGGTIYVPGERLPRMLLVVPWLPLTATLIVVPLAAMLVAGLFSRSRLPSERPAD